MKYIKLFIYGLILFLVACSEAPKTGPVKIKFDRDSCEKCRMLISDRYHAAQVRGGEKQQAHKFDDIGDAVSWLAEQPWKDDTKTEIWVTDHRTGEWLNARQAWYVREKQTPMNYGFSAETEQRETAIDYTTMVKGAIKISGKHHHNE